ncbi:MAG: LacI family transcriptional regulator [Treponema sp.]|jgi:LacI family transcriptional regulator|nr:LacI family transcriptional regulator [Treponema sp.]
MTNIVEIAKQLGVSPTTVSRVLNGKRYVAKEKRDRVLGLVRETGYVPNKAARAMALRQSFTIGIVFPTVTGLFQRLLCSVIEEKLHSYGYHTVFFFVSRGEAGEKTALASVQAEKLDGLILLHEIRSAELNSYCETARLPVVSAQANPWNIPTVAIDDAGAAFEAVSHLIGLGHRRIGILVGAGSFGDLRLKGYKDALKKNGVPLREELIRHVDYATIAGGARGVKRLLEQSGAARPTALFATNDELAVGAIRSLFDLGIRVPLEMSVIGFDDLEISAYTVPRLTTIRQPLKEMGVRLALLLYCQIQDAVITGLSLQKIPPSVLPHILIIRESTAPRVS